jgi:class 3 adenylate cyclase
MKILVLNCGSASVKYQLIETSPALAESGEERCLAAGTIEDVTCYDRAVGHALAAVAPHHAEIRAVGHRVVHGGDYFSGAAVIASGYRCSREIPERYFQHTRGTKPFRCIGKNFGAAFPANSDHPDHCRVVCARSLLYSVRISHALRLEHGN